MLTTHYLPGTPCWIDATSPDLDASVAFYAGLFGWRSVSLGPEHRDYRLCQIDGKTVAGIQRARADNADPAWLTYFWTPDADAIAKTIEQAGGAVTAPPLDIQGQGRMAVCADPAGAAFAVWQPGANKGLGMVTDPGSLGWVELHVPGHAPVRAFYEAVFGWSITDMPMGDLPYPVIFPAEGGEMSAVGGIAELQPGDHPHWLPYFEVPDCDATVSTAQRLGGTVWAPETVDEVGRMAFLADPHGARFAVITSSA
ncbi:VOC family protein [Nonomuraea sp. K274]|uniref:VOC family protein n=1 Tax=Nonomuraea cypriaca TaxID=1187855 RepID=A0A931ALK7_9ACTN|nr:VOC family protein [Nonomuraea cypriaca]MBF8191222.1 VOC family protein [Nonomuraea cypriaca]